jgi:hypothetical protein
MVCETHYDLGRSTDKSASCQATHAGTWLSIYIDRAMRAQGLRIRRHWRLLYLLSHHTHHDRSIHRSSIYGIRVFITIDEPLEKVRPHYALRGRRASRRCRGSGDYTLGCHQDVVTDTRSFHGYGDQASEWAHAGCEDYKSKERMGRIFQRFKTKNSADDAEYGNLLVRRDGLCSRFRRANMIKIGPRTKWQRHTLSHALRMPRRYERWCDTRRWMNVHHAQCIPCELWCTRLRQRNSNETKMRRTTARSHARSWTTNEAE